MSHQRRNRLRAQEAMRMDADSLVSYIEGLLDELEAKGWKDQSEEIKAYECGEEDGYREAMKENRHD